ncbi:TRAP transporter substrate-binding protein [Arsenicitalea aurantiaca]|uniref:TRAP transporter substrate-binding protein n=1 Tax=Arsenicitalea aurantiaca TaxID=1783274 RepID=A0A433XLZ0_9HYPH|nr:TRAP transporter substrate-binding protein [Arsenicitalea aurantiaca]
MKLGTLTLLTAALALSVTPVMAQYQDRTFRVSNGINEDHPVGDGVRAMQACLDERTGGALKLNAFWGNALGGDLQATQSLRSGTLEMVITSSSPLVGIVPALGVFDLPFLFSNEQEADAILDGEFGDYIAGLLPEFGLVNLAYWENGFRNLTNSRGPVEKWEDFEGLKVRVMQNNIFLDTFANMGANATPMAFGEVFSALETRAIDAQENPFVTIDTSQFYEVQDYLSVTNHAYTPFMVLFSKPIWDTLSEDEQTAMSDCAVVGRDAQRAAGRALASESLARVREAGMQINEISPEEQARMVEKAQVVYERHAEEIGVEVVERMQAALAELRAQ